MREREAPKRKADGFPQRLACLVIVTCLVGSSAGMTAKVDPEDVCGPDRKGDTAGPATTVKRRAAERKSATRAGPQAQGFLDRIQDSSGNHRKKKGADNDELLGHHGSDYLKGKGGRHILLGRLGPQEQQRAPARHPPGRNRQRLHLSEPRQHEGRGRPRKPLRGGLLWARRERFCGPGKDRARVRLTGRFRVRRWETIGHFCKLGPDGAAGGCLKPGEKRRD